MKIKKLIGGKYKRITGKDGKEYLYEPKTMQKYCDNCGRDKNPLTEEQLRLKEVILADDSGRALYCDDCRGNSQRKEVEHND